MGGTKGKMESSPDALAFRDSESKDSVLIRAAKDISFGSVSLLSLSVALVVVSGPLAIPPRRRGRAR